MSGETSPYGSFPPYPSSPLNSVLEGVVRFLPLLGNDLLERLAIVEDLLVLPESLVQTPLKGIIFVSISTRTWVKFMKQKC